MMLISSKIIWIFDLFFSTETFTSLTDVDISSRGHLSISYQSRNPVETQFSDRYIRLTGVEATPDITVTGVPSDAPLQYDD